LCIASTAYAVGEINVLKADREGVVLEWSLDAYQVTTVGEYSVVEFPGGSGYYGLGQPSLPAKQAFIELPMDGRPTIKLSEAVIETETLEFPVVPAQEPPSDTVGEQNLQKRILLDEAVYRSAEPFPARVVEFAYEGNLRGRRLALVRFNPMQYVPATKELRIYKHLTAEIDFGGSTMSLGLTDQAMEPLAKALISNYTPATITRDASADSDYLIVSVEGLAPTAERFAEWKRTKGLNVGIEYLPPQSAPAAIKAVIQKHYPVVKYVLILADHDVLPLAPAKLRHPMGVERLAKLGVEGDKVPSDLFYAMLDGNDYYPDVFIGRIPAGNSVEADLLVNKIIMHQDKAPAGDWRKRFLLCGEFQYQSAKRNVAERLFAETAFVIWNSLNRLFEFPTQTIGTGAAGLGHADYFFRLAADPKQLDKPGTYRTKIRDDKPPVIGCKMPEVWKANIVDDATAKKNTLEYWNKGVFMVQHRDHGGQTLWGKPSITKNDILALTNGDMLPILFSINCLTAYMDFNTDSFVEAALKNPNGGAAAALGATRVSYSWWNDRLVDGFYTAMFGGIYDSMDEGIKLPTKEPFSIRLAEILNFGKMYLALNYPSNPFGTSYDYTQTEFELFHAIGDPHMVVFPGSAR